MSLYSPGRLGVHANPPDLVSLSTGISNLSPPHLPTKYPFLFKDSVLSVTPTSYLLFHFLPNVQRLMGFN